MNLATGACLCGTVRFEAGLPSLWVAHCHCTMCQRAHGAPVVTWVGIQDSRFRVSAGSEHLRWHRSSAAGERAFCDVCGSSLLFRSTQWPGEIHIVLTNFDGPVDRAPQAHVFWDTHAAWLNIVDDLPKKTPA